MKRKRIVQMTRIGLIKKNEKKKEMLKEKRKDVLVRKKVHERKIDPCKGMKKEKYSRLHTNTHDACDRSNSAVHY